jgi:catechol 2,3-dioxygenase-like lactoylglutathione lyase family enzyme
MVGRASTHTQEAAMSTTTESAGAGTPGMDLEVIVLPVSDVDRAKEFYARLGWRLDADRAGDDFRLVQFTPPGSGCSVQFGAGLTAAAPGSVQDVYLAVADVVAARAQLAARGVEVSEVFHCATGATCRFAVAGPGGRVSGPAPDRTSYASFATFADPDGNGWLLQEVTARLPGRVGPAPTSFGSAADLASAMRRASAAHGEHEKRIGAADPDWPDWYARYMVAEQAGAELPT